MSPAGAIWSNLWHGGFILLLSALRNIGFTRTLLFIGPPKSSIWRFKLCLWMCEMCNCSFPNSWQYLSLIVGYLYMGVVANLYFQWLFIITCHAYLSLMNWTRGHLLCMGHVASVSSCHQKTFEHRVNGHDTTMQKARKKEMLLKYVYYI